MDTLIKFTGVLMKRVKQEIVEMLQDCFASGLRGYAMPGRIMWSYLLRTQRAQIEDLSVGVAFSPIKNEERHSAAEHVNLVHFVLWLLGKSSSNVLVLMCK